MSKKVVVAGHLCIDLTPVFPEGRKVSAAGELLKPGKLVSMEGINIHTGGVVSNTGLAMIYFGNDVRLMGKVGDDELGRMVLDILKSNGCRDTGSMIISKEVSTSYTIALAMPGLDRIFLHSPGANDSFGFDDIDFDLLNDTALFHFGYMPIMKKTYLNGGEEMVRILNEVRKRGPVISMDMAAVDPNSAAGAENWRALIERIAPYVDIFVPSIEELICMMDPDKYARLDKISQGGDMTEHLDIERDVKPLADELVKMGIRVAMIKCGAPGIYYKTAGEAAIGTIADKLGINSGEWADREGFETSFVPDRILSGTGAGDTSIAGFLTAMLKGYAPEKCVSLAAAAGASCLGGYDSLSGLIPFEDMEKKIAEGWKKNSL